MYICPYCCPYFVRTCTVVHVRTGVRTLIVIRTYAGCHNSCTQPQIRPGKCTSCALAVVTHRKNIAHCLVTARTQHVYTDASSDQHANTTLTCCADAAWHDAADEIPDASAPDVVVLSPHARYTHPGAPSQSPSHPCPLCPLHSCAPFCTYLNASAACAPKVKQVDTSAQALMSSQFDPYSKMGMKLTEWVCSCQSPKKGMEVPCTQSFAHAVDCQDSFDRSQICCLSTVVLAI